MAESPITTSGFLVVRANGEMRITKGRPRLRLDEVVFPVTVSIPTSWGRVQPTSIDVAMPKPPEARVTIGEPELDDDEVEP